MNDKIFLSMVSNVAAQIADRKQLLNHDQTVSLNHQLLPTNNRLPQAKTDCRRQQSTAGWVTVMPGVTNLLSVIPQPPSVHNQISAKHNIGG